MATAKEERERAANGEGCLGKAADNEPVFILRAQDRLAPTLVDEWATRLTLMSGHSKDEEPLRSKIEEARRIADQMRMWQGTNTSKVPD